MFEFILGRQYNALYVSKCLQQKMAWRGIKKLFTNNGTCYNFGWKLQAVISDGP